jgi:hypothetical protein
LVATPTDAVTVYKEALMRHPTDEVLKQNLELCLAKSEEAK